MGYVLSGAAGEFLTPGGQRDIDESFLVMMNAYYGDLDFRIPESGGADVVGAAGRHRPEPPGGSTDGRLYVPGEVYRLQAHSFALLINRAPRPELPAAAEAEAEAEIGCPAADGEEQRSFENAGGSLGDPADETEEADAPPA